MHMPGVLNPVDPLTKYVTAAIFFRAMSYLTNVPNVANAGPPHAEAKPAAGTDDHGALDLSDTVVKHYVARGYWGAKALAAAEDLDRLTAAGCEVAGSSIHRKKVLRQLSLLASAPAATPLKVSFDTAPPNVFVIPARTTEEQVLDMELRRRLATTKQECAALGGRMAAVQRAFADAAEVRIVQAVDPFDAGAMHPKLGTVQAVDPFDAGAVHSTLGTVSVDSVPSSVDLYRPIFLGRGGVYDYDSESSEESI